MGVFGNPPPSERGLFSVVLMGSGLRFGGVGLPYPSPLCLKSLPLVLDTFLRPSRLNRSPHSAWRLSRVLGGWKMTYELIRGLRGSLCTTFVSEHKTGHF